MKQIPLTQGLFAQVDDEDYEAAMAFKWTALTRARSRYAYRMVTKNRKARAIYLHRFIMNAREGLFIDHKDHDGLNCQKANMRECTRAQNCQNTRKTRLDTSSEYKGVRGVVKTVTRRYFKAYIEANGVVHYLGTFRREKEAALAYNEAAHRLHGEFAVLNPVV